MKKFFRNMIFTVLAILVGCTIGIPTIWCGILFLKINEGIGITICLASIIIEPLIGTLIIAWLEDEIY